MKETDSKIKQLFEVVKAKKLEISQAEKPNWETNCAFNYSRNSGDTNNRVNINVVQDINELISILAFLFVQKEAWEKAVQVFGVKTAFSWHGYSFEQWQGDLVSRSNKIRISEKKKELSTLEARLNAILSPELKAQLELEEITKLLES